MSTVDPTMEEQTPVVNPGNYSPVTVYMKDTVGAVFLGIFAAIVLVRWMRTEARYRALTTQREITDGSHSIDTQ